MYRLQLRLLSRSTTHKSKSKAPSGYRTEFFWQKVLKEQKSNKKGHNPRYQT